jgi:hypothetical protein
MKILQPSLLSALTGRNQHEFRSVLASVTQLREPFRYVRNKSLEVFQCQLKQEIQVIVHLKQLLVTPPDLRLF